MKIFASWSGDLSRELALAFREWLPKVLQGSSVFVSKKDIHSGENWLTIIIENLQDSDFGIAFVTENNLESPWLQFESGALALKFSKARITPLLCGIDNTKLNSSNPLSKFQAEEFDEEGIKSLLASIVKSSKSLGISPSNLDETYRLWMPELFNISSKIFEKFDNLKVNKVNTVKSAKQPVGLEEEVKSVLSDLVGEVRSLSSRMETKFDTPVVTQPSNNASYGLFGRQAGLPYVDADGSIGVYGSGLLGNIHHQNPSGTVNLNAFNRINTPAVKVLSAISNAQNLNDLYQIEELVAEESEYYSPAEMEMIDRELKELNKRLEPK